MLLTVSNVGVAFAADIVLEKVNLRLRRGEKAALVGRNGAGKSTLLKVILGELEPTSGSVAIEPGTTIGVLRQEHHFGPQATVRDVAEASLAADRARLSELARLEKRLAESPTDEEINRFADLAASIKDERPEDAERRLQETLDQMGLGGVSPDHPADSLSGGQKTRLALARLMVEQPDLLVLDEPTNHLDLTAAEELEAWVNNYPGAVLLVSHDRLFLEAAAQRVFEIRSFTVYEYPGSFAQFERLRREEDERLAKAAALQQAEFARMEEFIRKWKNSERTAQAIGREKILNRLKLNTIEAPKSEKGIQAGFAGVERSGDIVLEARGLSCGYGGKALTPAFDWTVRWQERWGVVGENGAGKTTLLRTLLGDLDPISGGIRLGSKVKVSVFTQDAVTLNTEQTPIDHLVWECGLDPGPARDLLGRFLITGDMAFQPIGSLSGGEKNKLVLAQLTHEQPNLLILDEPTNHLDMASRDALISVLGDFKGTLLIVSHDRHLLGSATDHILDVRRAGVTEYTGSFRDYRIKQAAGTSKSAAPAPKVENEAPTLSPYEVSRLLKEARAQISRIEDDVEEAEAALSRLENRLAQPREGDDLAALSQEHADGQTRIDGLMEEWEKAHREEARLLDMQNR